MARDTTTALVTCYNKADFILQCVEALVKCKEIDIIIVYDDASTDASLDLLQQTFGECTKVIILRKLCLNGLGSTKKVCHTNGV